MTKLILLCITLLVALCCWAQNKVDNGKSNSSYFMAFQSGKHTGGQIIKKEDKIAVKLKSKEFIRGRIAEMSNETIILTETKDTIELSSIEWIKKSKPSTESLVIGLVLTTAGVAVMAHVLEGSVDFDEIVPQGGAGIALISLGAAIITPPKFRLTKGDRLIYMIDNSE